MLYDEPDYRLSAPVRIACYSAGRIFWGVAWGGPSRSKLFKNFSLQPHACARGPRIDLRQRQLLRVCLRLDELLTRYAQHPVVAQKLQLRLPRLWAAYTASEAPLVSGEGPELERLASTLGKGRAQLFSRGKRDHQGFTLFPLPWVSHWLDRAVDIYVDLRLPRFQVFRVDDQLTQLQGFSQAAEFDFRGTCFERPGTVANGRTRKRTPTAAVVRRGTQDQVLAIRAPSAGIRQAND